MIFSLGRWSGFPLIAPSCSPGMARTPVASAVASSLRPFLRAALRLLSAAIRAPEWHPILLMLVRCGKVWGIRFYRLLFGWPE